MNDTHADLITLPDGSTAFVDGIPDTCAHDGNGDAVHFTASGKVIHWHTFRAWAGYTSQMRHSLIYEHQSQIGDPITGSAVTCSKCGKQFNPPSF
ncbi:hypothetical protein [Salmonirosea aquatica]|uniref:Uncharacterized protein n=1 Tax=Salmonirosea aquatica TaxID=2654236 RepID=A0A7C9BDV8_9BACT|nr:hypothetical protein [Cytophagaceae bacterium SJW1-29]